MGEQRVLIPRRVGSIPTVPAKHNALADGTRPVASNHRPAGSNPAEGAKQSPVQWIWTLVS